MEGGIEHFAVIIRETIGYVYPNEILLHWGILVVVYPYITGLVAGAFILASLENVFKVKEIQPTYRLSMLTALAFLIAAPLPLLAHLGHPERSIEIFITPNLSSAMAMFGFIYIWYLMVVLLLELWFEYRKDMVIWSQKANWIKKLIYKIFSLGVTDISEKAVRFDRKAGRIITIIGIPSAILLHGYVGFIFGSVKANPWWSSVLMPIVFLFSAMVSGISLVILLYMIVTPMRRKRLSMKCLDKLASYLFYAMLLDFSLEALDFIHRIYESEESIKILSQLLLNKLFISIVVIQVLIGTLIPLGLLAWNRLVKLPVELRRLTYFISAILTQIGIFSIRWNVVIGGQLFSKSLKGLTTYKVEFFGTEGLLMAGVLLILPFIILYILVLIFPPWGNRHAKSV